MERVARCGRLRAIRAAVGPSLECGAGPPGASAASWVLSGSRTEAGEEGRRSRVEASVEEAVLSCPWEVHTALWGACPLAGVEACQGAEALVLDWILVEQGAEAPCQEEQEVAWASEASLDASLQAGTVVAQVEVHHRRPVGPVRAWPWRGALLEAWTREEEQEGNLEAACLALASLCPSQ